MKYIVFILCRSNLKRDCPQFPDVAAISRAVNDLYVEEYPGEGETAIIDLCRIESTGACDSVRRLLREFG